MSEETPKNQNTTDAKKDFILYIHDVICLLSAMLVLLLLIFRMVIVSGTSMNMTLLDGDYLLLLSNTFYTEPEYGDIIVVSKDSFDNGTAFVKRVIATEGQTVDIDFAAGIVYVDGVALQEDYVNTMTNVPGCMTFPLVVDEGCVFAMGDNRNISRDSRYPEIGLIDSRQILGRAIFLLIPGTNTDLDPQPRDFSRIGVIN